MANLVQIILLYRPTFDWEIDLLAKTLNKEANSTIIITLTLTLVTFEYI